MSKKKSVNNQVVEQIVEEVKEEEVKEEIKLTPEEQKLLKLLKYKIKDLEQFAELSRLIHWFHHHYKIGQISDVYDTPFFKLFETTNDSFIISNNAWTTALTFNIRENWKNIAVGYALTHIKPLSKYLDDLVIQIHYPFDAIVELLRKYMEEKEAIEMAQKIKKMLELPCSVRIDGQDDVVMIIAPRTWEG